MIEKKIFPYCKRSETERWAIIQRDYFMGDVTQGLHNNFGLGDKQTDIPWAYILKTIDVVVIEGRDCRW